VSCRSLSIESFSFGNTCRLWPCAGAVRQQAPEEDREGGSNPGEDAHRLGEDGRHRVAWVEAAVPNQAAEGTHSLDAQDPHSEEDKHYADLANPVEDMDELPLDPDTGLVSQDLGEDMGSGRLVRPTDVLEATAVRNSHRGLRRPEADTEGVEAPWSRPFVPCVVQRSWGGWYNRSRFPQSGRQAARKQPRLTENGQGEGRRGVSDCSQSVAWVGGCVKEE
jgi:hypothetical protein